VTETIPRRSCSSHLGVFGGATLTSSSFDPASLEILRQLGQVASTQDDLLHLVRAVASTQAQPAQPVLTPSVAAHAAQDYGSGRTIAWHGPSDVPMQQHAASFEWPIPEPESATTSPSASAGVAAVRWFGLFASDVSQEAVQDASGPLGFDGLLDNTGDDETASPLQLATRIIDAHQGEMQGEDIPEESLWQASESIQLLPPEQLLFEHFLHRICSWVSKTVSVHVPLCLTHLARPLRPSPNLFCPRPPSRPPQRRPAQRGHGSRKLPSLP
jgi:hypothetical protein